MASPQEPPDTVFATEAEARELCRVKEREGGGLWISWRLADGRWQAAATNVPGSELPSGELTEAKPRPPEPDDPRSAPQRALGGGYH